ncbi:MAG: cytochrome c oxidase subunit II [Nitrospira sp.]|nr:cytochrome c oxidase subunit II [Nitrospira sp.]
MFLSAASITGKQTDTAMIVIGSINIALLAIIVFFTLFFVIKYSKKRNPSPTDIEGSKPVEILFLIFSISLVLFMFNTGWKGYKELRVEIPSNAMSVKATGQMWHWSFEYENGKQSDVLNLPLNQPVIINITSVDLIHSFYIPAFRVKQDALPGSVRRITFTPDEKGEYDLFCAEYCGTGHSMMITKTVVMSDLKFREWYNAAE